MAGKWRLQRKIGGGSFGAVYIGNERYLPSQWLQKTHSPRTATDVDSGNEVAIKLEHISIDPSFLEREADVYQSLSGGTGIPRVYAYTTECEYHAMVFDLLGPSLEDLFNFCGREFSLKTVLMLVDQLLRRLEYIHSHDVIHRDIKPENCLLGTGKQGNLLYVTDLGLATERRDAPVTRETGRPQRPKLIGTARFASVNGHLGDGKCSALIYCRLLTDDHPSPKPLRRFGISRVHASLLPQTLSSLARSQGRKSRAKGGAYLGKEKDDHCRRPVRRSTSGICGLLPLHSLARI